jgi:hypothetical protein
MNREGNAPNRADRSDSGDEAGERTRASDPHRSIGAHA